MTRVQNELLRTSGDFFDRLEKIGTRDEFVTDGTARLEVSDFLATDNGGGSRTGEVEDENVVVVGVFSDLRERFEDGVARRVGVNEHRDVAFRPLRILEKRVAERLRVVDGRDQVRRRAGIIGDADDDGAVDRFVDERVGLLRNDRGERIVFHEEVGDRHTEFIFRVGRKARDLAGSDGRLPLRPIRRFLRRGIRS